MSITSLSTAMTLDTRVPIAITAESEFFEDICKVWDQRVLVVDLMKREAIERARFAVKAVMDLKPIAKQYMEEHPTIPQFLPAVRQTAPIPVITEAGTNFDVQIGKSMPRLLEAWAHEEIVEAHRITRVGRMKRFGRRVRFEIEMAIHTIKQVL